VALAKDDLVKYGRGFMTFRVLHHLTVEENIPKFCKTKLS